MDWTINYIKKNDIFVDAHTTGLGKYNHLELCIVLNLDKDTVETILNSMAKAIQNGKVYNEGICKDVIGEGRNVYLKKYDNDDTLYVLFSDPNGRLPIDDDCCELYSKQLECADLLHYEKLAKAG